jgi:shikimate dehydrogenase
MKKTYGLIGFPLTHSFSKKYFTEKFQKENITDAVYNLYSLSSIHQLPDLLKDNQEILGLNVTIPYKESVIPFLNELDATAKAVGAVNCIKIEWKNDKTPWLKGYNTDVFGFRQSIKPFLEKRHERAIILGTGGAAKAAAYVLKEIGLDCYFVTRFKNNQKSQISNSFAYADLNEYIFNAFKLIVNTTPVGMFPNVKEAPSIPYDLLTPSHLLYDMVYNPAETEFLKRGKEKGAETINGISMLHQQAEEAWRIWNK